MQFIIRAPRVIDEDYVHASPEDPKIVEIPDKYFPKDKHGKPVFDPDNNPTLELWVEGKTLEAAKLKSHYAEVQKGQEIKLGPNSPPPAKPTVAKQSQRASDTEAF